MHSSEARVPQPSSKRHTYMTTPIFIFSLPRSGSTLLQRILASHPDVSTAPEPWLLLPFIHSLRPQGVYAEYDHRSAAVAISRFLEMLPDGIQDYNQALRGFALELYDKAARGKKFFVDKTPRYHAVNQEIMGIFPDAKYVFLFRNPLATLASIMRTWPAAHVFNYDIYQGFDSLFAGYEASQPTVFFLRYEDLVTEPAEAISRLCEYLGLDYRAVMLEDFAHICFKPTDMGNPVPRQTQQANIVNGSENDWLHYLCENAIRKTLALSYLDYIGEHRMRSIGYDFVEWRGKMLAEPFRIRDIQHDLKWMLRGMLSVHMETPIMKDKIRDWLNRKKIYAHR